MQWTGPKQKELGIKLGFVVTGSGRDARVVNLDFNAKDVDKNNPREARLRPASMAEVAMWRELLRA